MTNRVTMVLLIGCAFANVVRAQSIMQFESPIVGVPNFSVEEDGFILSSPKAAQFVNGGGLAFRNPGPGLLNLNGLNTVPYNGSQYAVPFTASEPIKTEGWFAVPALWLRSRRV